MEFKINKWVLVVYWAIIGLAVGYALGFSNGFGFTTYNMGNEMNNSYHMGLAIEELVGFEPARKHFDVATVLCDKIYKYRSDVSTWGMREYFEICDELEFHLRVKNEERYAWKLI